MNSAAGLEKTTQERLEEAGEGFEMQHAWLGIS